MEHSIPYDSISAALSALIYDMADSGGEAFSGQTLNEILENTNFKHKDELQTIIDANGLGNAKILDTSWQSGNAGKYGSMNAATFEIDGKLFVAYRGTGDGNWPYNADSAYGYEASEMQKWASSYFDDVMDQRYSGQEVYVTGHSQGGNNAMYASFFSKNNKYITNYISFDGPGFSQEMIDQARYLNSNEYYEQIRQKGYAINGNEDFVHNLGEGHMTPEDHIRFVEARMDDPTGTHDLYSHFKLDGTLGDACDEGAISRLATELNTRMLERLPKKERYKAGQAIMKIIENLPGESATVQFKEGELENVKLLIPILAEVLEEQPELLDAALHEAGLQPAIADLIVTIVNEFNELSPELRERSLAMLIDCMEVNDEGYLTINWSNLDVWTTIEAAFPVILETAIHHPDQLVDVFFTLGLDKKIEEWLKENPAVVVLLVMAAPLLAGLIKNTAVFLAILDAVYHIVKGIVGVAKEVIHFVLTVLDAIKQAFQKLGEWFFKRSSGYRYAQTNPWFRVDTDALRNYAIRLENLNRRLVQLDHDMDNLYPQVRLRDLISVFSVNWSTSWSLTLARAARDLRATADEFDAAENKACGYLGG